MANGDPFYIGSYRTTREIGEGAFGLVYQAYQPFLDRQVAVKTLHADLSAEPRIEQQFMHEARTIARLRHPNIVSVYEFGTAEIRAKASTYMVMEFLSGETLQAALRRGPVPVAEVVSIVEQLGKALDYAHERNVIHRDLKPANIMFTDQFQPVIVDFGLAKLMALSGFSQGNGGKSVLESTMSGTPAYMSPEQVANEPVGPASDQYSLATIAYEMLSGRLPFAGSDPQQLAMQKLQATPPLLSSIAPGIRPEVDRVFQRALLRDPQSRFGSAGEFADALAEALLPDRVPTRVVTITDPVQAAQLRIARQTVLGFLWGLVVVTLVIAIFCTGQFIRGFLTAAPLFVWDGIIASDPVHNGLRDVIGIWPGSSAEKAGILPGDALKTDIAYDRLVHDGDYTVNGVPRSSLPINWQAQPGDVITRTIYRNGRPIKMTYPLERSPYQLIVLVIQLVPALLAFLCAIWLIHRWGAEPGVQLFSVVLLAGSFTLIASGISNLLQNIDTLALFIQLPLYMHFVLVFPEPLPFTEKHRRALLWLYAPLLLGVIEFTIGGDLIPGLNLNIIIFMIYAAGILLAVILKWIRRDLKRYPRLRLLIATMILAAIVGLASPALFVFSDYATVKALWGNGLNLFAIAYGLIVVGAIMTILMGTLGYHRVQLAMGPSLINQDSQPGRLFASQRGKGRLDVASSQARQDG